MRKATASDPAAASKRVERRLAAEQAIRNARSSVLTWAEVQKVVRAAADVVEGDTSGPWNGMHHEALKASAHNLRDLVAYPPAPDPSGGGLTEAERERLARLMWETRIEQGGPVPDAARPNLAWDAIPVFFRDRDREVADAILASPWLADHVAAARRDAWDEGYAAGSNDTARESRSPGPTGVPDAGNPYRAALDPVTRDQPERGATP